MNNYGNIDHSGKKPQDKANPICKSKSASQRPSKAKSDVGKAHSTQVQHFDLARIRRIAPKTYRSYPAFAKGETENWAFQSDEGDAVFMVFKDKELKSKVDSQYASEGIHDEKGNYFQLTKGKRLVTFLAVKGNKDNLWATR